jgi:hypothetical protein
VLEAFLAAGLIRLRGREAAVQLAPNFENVNFLVDFGR